MTTSLKISGLCFVAMLFGNCRRGEDVSNSVIGCVRDEVQHLMSDSSATLCLPPGFVARSPTLFARSRGDELPENWIAVSLSDSANTDASQPWPVHLASGSGCLADCATVEELRAYEDTIAGLPAHVERGLVSGGISGERRQPALVVSITLPTTRRAIINAFAVDTALLDTLAHAVRRFRP